MTPETIKAAFDAEFKQGVRSEVIAELLCSAQRLLTRILCPAARPDSAGEGGKDRAGEMAAKRISAFGYYIRFLDAHGTIVMSLPGESDDLDLLREWFANALREYGDELLEKAAGACVQRSPVNLSHTAAWFSLNDIRRVLASLKSSPTGAPHV